MAKQLEKKHTLATRWMHWINFPLLAMMIWSGLLIYWANAVYSIRIFGYELFHFFPAGFYEFLSIPYRLAEGLQLHFFFMWLFAANGLVYSLYTIFSGEWRSLLPVPSSFRRATRVALHDAHIVKDPPPQGKYNDAQRLAYTSVILMGAGSVITGLAIYKPTQLAWLTSLLGGYDWARWEHFWLMVLFVLFFAVHVIQVALAGWGNFRSMMTGYDVVDARVDGHSRGECRGRTRLSDKNGIKSDEVRELPSNDAWPGGRDNTANILGEQRKLSEPMDDGEARRAMSRRSRRGFIVGGAAALIGIFGWRWMPDETKARLLRRTLEFNEWVSQNLYSPKRLAPEFPPERITADRVNGMLGLETPVDPLTWSLAVAGLTTNEVTLTLDDIRSLPRTEMITEFKCIEGWSLIQKWAGVRVSELVARYGGGSSLPKYVSMSTPDDGYFVGWDVESILHPQTLLAYELNGQPLTSEHGAPLRLASPLKYGIKQIKRIGRIEFTNERPKDYWAQEGYDWYSGH